jgi:phage protein D
MRKEGRAYRFNGSYTVELPTLPSLQARPSVVELYQGEGKHDIVVLSFANYRPAWSQLLKTGTPIILNLSNGVGKLRWVGYVNFTSEISAAQVKRPTKVYCIGPSFALKNRSTRVFSDLTIPEAVGRIAKEHGLNYVGEPHPRRFNQLSISGESYWQWIQSQAHRIGYVAIAEGSNLFFRSLDRTLDERMSYVPAYLFSESLSDTGLRNPRSRTIDSFEVIQGNYAENVDEPRTSKTVSTVDLTSREVISRQGVPEATGSAFRAEVSDTWFAGYETDVTVGNALEAQQAATAAAQRVRFTTEATLRGFGEPRLGVFSTVLVSGTGSNTDGYWAVAEAHHRVDLSGLYTVTMKLRSDGLGENSGSTFRRKFDHGQDAIDIRSGLVSDSTGKPAKGARLRIAPQVLSTRGTARKASATPGQWVAD